MLSDSGRSRGHAAGWNEFRGERLFARYATWHSRPVAVVGAAGTDVWSTAGEQT